MKHTYLITLGMALAVPATLADQAAPAEAGNAVHAKKLAEHAAGAKQLALEQDELSADVQDLIDEQTDPKVIAVLREIEVAMADATDLLDQKKTDGPTIAVETEIIEKIFEAAKKKKEQQEKKDGG
jgi:hypothetical protein